MKFSSVKKEFCFLLNCCQIFKKEVFDVTKFLKGVWSLWFSKSLIIGSMGEFLLSLSTKCAEILEKVLKRGVLSRLFIG